MTKLRYITNGAQGSPDFSRIGFNKARLLTSFAFFARNSAGYIHHKIDMPTVRRVLESDSWLEQLDMPIVFDIETLDPQPYQGSEDRPGEPDEHARDFAKDQLIQVVKAYREHPYHQHRALGYYGVLPYRDVWNARHCVIENGDMMKCARWRKTNASYFYDLDDQDPGRKKRGLVSYVDRVYPSLYWWYPDWPIDQVIEQYLEPNLQEARKYEKPIIPFVSPFKAGHGEEFDEGYWRDMLSYVYNHEDVDGVWLWAITPEWKDNAAWWKVVQEVML